MLFVNAGLIVNASWLDYKKRKMYCQLINITKYIPTLKLNRNLYIIPLITLANLTLSTYLKRIFVRACSASIVAKYPTSSNTTSKH